MILSLFVGFVLGVAALLFASQNTEIVSLTFLGWQFSTSLAILVLASVGVGILISILASLPSVISSSFKIMGLRKTNKMLVQEVEGFRAQKNVENVESEPASVIDLRQ